MRYFLFLNMSLMSKRQPITAAEWLYILLLLSPLLEEISQAQEQGLRIWWRSSRNRVDAVVLVALVSGCVLRVLLARSVIYRLAGAAIVSIAIVSIAIVNIAIVSIAIVSITIVSLRSSARVQPRARGRSAQRLPNDRRRGVGDTLAQAHPDPSPEPTQP